MSTVMNEPIGAAVLCDSAGNPVHTRFTGEDTLVVADMQDAEEEPMLRDIAA